MTIINSIKQLLNIQRYFIIFYNVKSYDHSGYGYVSSGGIGYVNSAVVIEQIYSMNKDAFNKIGIRKSHITLTNIIEVSKQDFNTFIDESNKDIDSNP